MSIAEHNDVPAAWYPDQNVPDQLRWWDGQGWTADVRPVETAATAAVASASAEAPLLESRRSLHAVAKPAQGFGHATPDQLRSWPAPYSEHRSEVEVPVREMPREWSKNESVDAIKGWMAKSPEPVPSGVEDLGYVAARIASPQLAPVPRSIFPPVQPMPEPDAAPVAAAPESLPLPAFPASSIPGSFPPASPAPSAFSPASPPAAEPFDEITAARPYADLSDYWRSGGVLPERPSEVEPTAPAVEAPGPRQPATTAALSRRQLREMLGGPLTNGAEAV